jgi:hypothetical protein
MAVNDFKKFWFQDEKDCWDFVARHWEFVIEVFKYDDDRQESWDITGMTWCVNVKFSTDN